MTSDTKTQKETFVLPSQVPMLARNLKDRGFDFFVYLTAVDYGDTLELLYHVRSLERGEDYTWKVRLNADNTKVPSIADIYKGAEWHEREAYDLFGIEFEGHPDLRRILLSEDWEGHPLRKSYAMDTPKLPYRPPREKYEAWKK